MPVTLGPCGPFRVRGAGTAFPGRTLSTEEVIGLLASRHWSKSAMDPARVQFIARGLEESLGVVHRAWAHVPGEPFDHAREPNTLDLAVEASQKALGDARMEATEISLVLCSTSTPSKMTSTLSAALGARLGTKAACMDLRTGCAAGLFALTTAATWMGAGTGPVLLVGTETFSKVIPPQSKPACVSLGDGAGAIVLEPKGSGGLRAAYLATDGTLGHLVSTDGALPPTAPEIQRGGYLLSGEPEELAALLPLKYAEAIAAVLGHSKLGPDDMDLYVPHQTNVALIREVASRAGIRSDKTFVNVARHANVGAAGWIVALAEARAEGRFQGRVLLSAVGGGMSWAATILET